MKVPLLLGVVGLLAMQDRVPGVDMPSSLLMKKPSAGSTVLRVDGKEVKVEEVEALLWDWRREEVLSDLLDDRVVRNEAVKAKLTATDNEVDTALSELMEGLKASLPPGKTLEAAMMEQGASKSRLWLRVRTEVLLRKLALRDFESKNFVKISTIVIKPKSSSADDLKAALTKAESVHKRLTSNEKWADVFLSVTEDARARASLGLVGWRNLSAFPADAQQEIMKLDRLGISKPIQTVNGIQVFRIDAFGRDASGDTLRELEDAYYNGRRTPLLTRLKSEARVERLD